MRKWFAAIVLSCLAAVSASAFGQEVKDLLKGARPATGVGEDLAQEARQPRYYDFKLDTAILVFVRSVAADDRGNKTVALEVRSMKFAMDPRDNHLTATASIIRVGVAPVIRTIHVAIYDKERRLIGTGSCRQQIEKFVSNLAPVATPDDVKIDFGESPRYFAAESFQVAVTGRGRSEFRYTQDDIDELIRRLGDEDHPEAPRDAAMWLIRLGEPIIPRLSVLTKADKPVAGRAIWVLGEIGGEKVVDMLASVLLDPQRPVLDRVRAAAGLGNTGEPGVKFLARGLQGDQPEEVVAAIFGGLAKSHSKEAAEILTNCLGDSKKYYGATRARLIVYLQEMNDPIAIPGLIQALRDPSNRARTAAAVALEKLAKHSVPIKGQEAGASEVGWMYAPLEARETAVKEWEKWWETNKGRFSK